MQFALLLTGVGLEADMVELESIASKPKKYHTFLVADLKQVILIDKQFGLRDALCAETYPSPFPNVANAGKW